MPLLILFFLFIVLPIAELYVIIQVGQAIGIVPTLAILLLDGILGAALSRSQGRTAWRRFNEATAAGKVPAKEVFDGACIIVGGAFLLAPGFITDVIGLSLLIPPSRAIYRRLLVGTARRVGPARPVMFFYDRRGSVPGAGGPQPSGSPPPPRRPSRGYDVEGSAREIPDDPSELGPGEARRDG
jgi:UPF0716 protein FxsA